MDLSIIIVNWNTRQVTCDCLESIYKSNTKLNYEVIVIDNNSSDDSVVKIKERFPQVQLIECDRNGGFAWANNIGMEIASGEYYLLLNSDTLILGDVLDRTYSFMKEHPDAGIVGCKVLNKDRTLQPTCFMYPSILNMFISILFLNKLFPRNRFFGREQMTWWNRMDEREVQVVTGCFMFVEKKKIDIVGLMDDSFFMYAEETDWCYRFSKAGFHNYYTPGGNIVHLGGVSTSKVKAKMILQLRRSVLLFIKKNKSLTSYLLFLSLTFFWFVIRTPMFLKRIIRSWFRS